MKCSNKKQKKVPTIGNISSGKITTREKSRVFGQFAVLRTRRLLRLFTFGSANGTLLVFFFERCSKGKPRLSWISGRFLVFSWSYDHSKRMMNIINKFEYLGSGRRGRKRKGGH